MCTKLDAVLCKNIDGWNIDPSYRAFKLWVVHPQAKKKKLFGCPPPPAPNFWKLEKSLEKVYFRSQILERPSIGEYWNIFGVPVLPENVIFTFFRTCWCYLELTILERKNGLVLSNTRVPVSGTWSILFPFDLLKLFFKLLFSTCLHFILVLNLQKYKDIFGRLICTFTGRYRLLFRVALTLIWKKKI